MKTLQGKERIAYDQASLRKGTYYLKSDVVGVTQDVIKAIENRIKFLKDNEGIYEYYRKTKERIEELIKVKLIIIEAFGLGEKK